MAYSKAFINSIHYHLWTDVLHARALAHQANNYWDRGSYVRWTIITAWSVLEIVCQDVLENESIGYHFKDDLDKSLAQKGYHKLDWSKGIWQQVLKLRSLRRNFVHIDIPYNQLLPDLELADWTILVVRETVNNIYTHCSKEVPGWIQDNNDRGWDKGTTSVAHLTHTEAGAKDHPEAIKIAYLYKGEEHYHKICLPDADYEGMVREFIKTINPNFPISLVRVYKGKEIVLESQLNMRGG